MYGYKQAHSNSYSLSSLFFQIKIFLNEFSGGWYFNRGCRYLLNNSCELDNICWCDFKNEKPGILLFFNNWMIIYVLCILKNYYFIILNVVSSWVVNVKVKSIAHRVMCVCYSLCTMITCPNYEVVRVIQPIIKPQTVANPELDSGGPTIIIWSQQHGMYANNKRLYHTQNTLKQIWIQHTKSKGHTNRSPN